MLASAACFLDRSGAAMYLWRLIEVMSRRHDITALAR
jgi:hypothetical protein